jgi:GNAT superfamily N-acetyltransferase
MTDKELLLDLFQNFIGRIPPQTRFILADPSETMLGQSRKQFAKDGDTRLRFLENDKIRPANPQDIPLLPEIERAAEGLFDGLELVQDLNHEVPVEKLERAQKAGRLWVATEQDGNPVGFALAIKVDGLAHLDELDVRPEHGKRGLGTALVETVCEWAKSAGFAAITLSTSRPCTVPEPTLPPLHRTRPTSSSRR